MTGQQTYFCLCLWPSEVGIKKGVQKKVNSPLAQVSQHKMYLVCHSVGRATFNDSILPISSLVLQPHKPC